jgi:alanine racemase
MEKTTELRPRAWTEFDAAALEANAHWAAERAGGAAHLIAVVKADAYGHGMKRTVSALRGKVGAFAVANLAEALAIAPEADGTSIYLLSAVLPEERSSIVQHGFMAPVASIDEADAFAHEAASLRTTAKVVIVVDSGMGRIGASLAAFPALLDHVRATGSLQLDSVASHFPVADDDPDFTRDQAVAFRTAVAGSHIQLANSAGLLGGFAHGSEQVRLGLMLYGVSPRDEFHPNLRPVLSWRTRITQTRTVPKGWTISYGRTFTTARETRVATLAVGYADGYPRHLSGQGAEVLIRGRRAPVVGRVTMDQIMVDVTDLPEEMTLPGAIVTLLGADGPEIITAWQLARRAGTIPWEIFTNIRRRVGL